MPSITAVPYPTRGYVYVSVSFADVPAATNVCVEAVNTVTGARRQLHPYISYNASGCLALSCGQAIFYDTELPCGVAMQYCATAIAANGATVTTSAAPLLSNTFSTVTASSWPTCDTGQAVVNTGGAAADYSGTGSRGQQAVTSTGVARVSSVAMTTPNATASALLYPAALALTQTTEQYVWLRADAAGANGYRARIRYNTSGTADLIMEKVVANVATTLDGTSIGFMTYGATSVVAVKLQTWGSTISSKAWDATTPEPAAFQSVATDTTFTASGVAALSSIRSAGNTNGTVNFQFDNWLVADVCTATANVTVCSSNVTIACDGCFRLGDPLRPCNDIQVCMCYDGVACGGSGGTFFAGMSPDTYASNSATMLPVNSPYPIPINRLRRAVAGSFQVVPTSFAARDALVNLLAAGGPLLWRGPTTYGTGDRYIEVADTTVAPQIADLTIQPRLVDLPFYTVKAPVGPSQGVCGTRFTDLCSGAYQTWDAMTAAGLSYADLLRGAAGTTPLNQPTWNLVNATYASWNALNAAQTSWDDTIGGVP